jgi:pimeloyl-ACP methyl ester carboxylesterase
MPERTIRAGDVEICTEAFGNPVDPTILLVMGATASMLRWDEDFCGRLVDGRRHVIRYDNRDTGRSTTYPPGQPDYTVEDLADDAVAVLDGHRVGQAHVVGASMGGMIAQQVALRHPDRVLTITPIMSTPDPSAVTAAMSGDGADLPGPTDEVLAVLGGRAQLDWSDQAAVVDEVVKAFRTMAGSRYPFDEDHERSVVTAEVKRAVDYASIDNHGIAVANTPPWRHRLGEIHVPALVIHGDEDPILPYPHGAALAAEIPGARLLTMEGVGHELPRGVWDTVVPAILEHTDARG